MEIHQKIAMPNYKKLKTMVKRCTDQKLRLRNLDARNEKIETGVVVPSRRDEMALKEEKDSVICGKQKVSVREETNAVSATCKTDSKNCSTL